jgi:hypothetical protein
LFWCATDLSSNIRNQSFMLSGGLFEPLMHETTLSLDPKSKSDHECTRYCLLTLTNLAVNPANQGMIMKFGLDTLAQFSKHRDIKCRQHAVFCIGNLCASADNLEPIMGSGCLRTLITYAFPSSDSSSNVQFQAVAALRGIATHPILRVQIVREGALEPLIMSAKNPSIEVQRETAAALCNLAMSETNKREMASGGVLPALVGLAMSGDEQRELHASAALANIAELVEGNTQNRMIDEGVIKPLLRLADSPNALVRREVARCFSLFASKRDSHAALVRNHAAVRMMTFLRDTDEVAQRYGVLGIGNLAVSRESHQELFDVGAIAQLVDCAKANDVMTKRAVAFTMNNIASNPANHVPCERLGLTRALVSLLADADKDTNLQATLATRHLCESAKFRNQFTELNGIPVLLALGLSEDVEVKREVAATLRNISLSVHSKVVMVREHCLQLLNDFMHSPDVEICHQATGVVANLAESTENQALMVDNGVIQHLKYVMRSKSIDVQREAARALANISAEYTCKLHPPSAAPTPLFYTVFLMFVLDLYCYRCSRDRRSGHPAVACVGHVLSGLPVPALRRYGHWQPGLPPLEPEKDHAGGRPAQSDLYLQVRERRLGEPALRRPGADQPVRNEGQPRRPGGHRLPGDVHAVPGPPRR